MEIERIIGYRDKEVEWDNLTNFSLAMFTGIDRMSFHEQCKHSLICLRV